MTGTLNVERSALTDLAGTQLEQVASGLATDTAHHWRARLQYFPSMTYDRWVSFGATNGETDFRTGGASCVPAGHALAVRPFRIMCPIARAGSVFV